MSAVAAPRLYYMPRTRSSRVLWLLEEIGAPYELTEISGTERRCASVLQGANTRELLRPWPGLEAYVRRSESRPAYARAAAISDRPRS